MQLLSTPVPSDPTDFADIPKDWVDCAWVDGYFLLASRNGQLFNSLLFKTEFDQLEFARAESNPDGLIGMEVLGRRIYLFGTKSIEQWFNVGGADFAFARDNGIAINIGCAAKATIAKNETHLIFLGSNGIVYVMQGGQIAPISSDTVAYDIARSIQSKARAYIYTEENHRFYVLTLYFNDDEQKTWSFDFNTNLWHERTQTDILCVEQLDIGPGVNQRRNLVGKINHDHIFDQRLDWGQEETDSGVNPILRECISPVLFANLQRVNNYTFIIDIPLRESTEDDIIEFRTLDQNEKKSIIQSKKLNQGSKFRFNRLGQFYYGRRFQIKTKAIRRVDILSAYVETDVFKD